MPDLVELEAYCHEARSLIVRAEEAVLRMEQNGACEGHRLMAAQGLGAIKHLNRIIELHRNRLAFEALPEAVSQPLAPRRNWLAVMRHRLTIGGAGLETQA